MIGGGGGECPEPAYNVLRPYKTAADWLNCSATDLMDRGDRELVDAACVASRAEADYLKFERERERQQDAVRARR